MVFNEAIADIGERFLAKGVRVYLEGHLQTRYTTEVVLSRFDVEMTILSRASLANVPRLMPRVVLICLETEQAAVVRTMISHSRHRCSEASFSGPDNAWITNSQRARRATLTCDGRWGRDELLSGNVYRERHDLARGVYRSAWNTS